MGWVLDFEETFDGALTARGAAFGNWTQLEVFSNPSLKRDGTGALVADTPGSFASWLRRTTTNADKYKVSFALTAWDTTQALNEAILSIRSASSVGDGGMLTAYNVRLRASELVVQNTNTALQSQSHSAAMANGELGFATVEVAPGTVGTTNLTAKAWKGTWGDEASPISTVSLTNEATGPQTGGAVGVGHNGSSRLSPSWGITTIRGYVWVDDTTAPTISGLEIQANGTTLRATFTEAGSPPILPASAITGLSLSGLSGGAVTVGNGTRVTNTTADFPLGRTVYQGETGALGAYASGNITDSASPPNSMTSASGIAVTNSSTQPAPASLTISPTSAQVLVNATQQFTATPTQGTLPDVIIWSVVGGAGNGTITNGGLYTAPATPGDYQVQAQRTNHPSVVATATVTVTAAPGSATTYLVLTQQGAFATTGNLTGTGLSSSLIAEVRNFTNSTTGALITVSNLTITEPYTGLYALRFTSALDLSKCGIFVRDPASGIVATLEASTIIPGTSGGSAVPLIGLGPFELSLNPGCGCQLIELTRGETVPLRLHLTGLTGQRIPVTLETLSASLERAGSALVENLPLVVITADEGYINVTVATTESNLTTTTLCDLVVRRSVGGQVLLFKAPVRIS